MDPGMSFEPVAYADGETALSGLLAHSSGPPRAAILVFPTIMNPTPAVENKALMLGDAVLLPSRIKLDKPIIAPDSATRDFWKDWGTQAPDVEAINRAVEALRSQTRSKPA